MGLYNRYGHYEICGGTPAECKGPVSFDDAQLQCENMAEDGRDNVRLCSADEILSDVARGTGCHLDHGLVWTTTECNISVGNGYVVNGRLGLRGRSELGDEEKWQLTPQCLLPHELDFDIVLASDLSPGKAHTRCCATVQPTDVTTTCDYNEEPGCNYCHEDTKLIVRGNGVLYTQPQPQQQQQQ
eukprot:m.68009 g.68009  ORF g.68009 m.68009 type:complete len:185 (-) comp11930_c0_seq1:582-1136(-)